jgi:hypothetical protein
MAEYQGTIILSVFLYTEARTKKKN